MERALAAIEEVEVLQIQMQDVLDVLKNLSERIVALENAGRTGGRAR